MTKKKWVAVVCIVTAMLLSGCGEVTLEEKVAKVQSSNTITVQDVMDLMELEGLEITQLATDAGFKKHWPDAVLLNVNDNIYVALQSFDENLYNRKSVLRDTGWYAGFGTSIGDPSEPMIAVNYIGTKYLGYDENWWINSAEYWGKNIVALTVPVFPENFEQMSYEEQYAVMNEINATSSGIKRVFYNDINGMITETIMLSSDNFTVEGTLHYYATGVMDEDSARKPVYYDVRTWLNCTVEFSDAIMSKYEGEKYEIKLIRPNDWEYGGGSSWTASTVEPYQNKVDIPNRQTEDIRGSAPENPPVYELIVTVGDITETFLMEPVTE